MQFSVTEIELATCNRKLVLSSIPWSVSASSSSENFVHKITCPRLKITFYLEERRLLSEYIIIISKQ